MAGVGEKRKRPILVEVDENVEKKEIKKEKYMPVEEDQKERFSRLKSANQTEIAFDFDESECDYMVIASNKNIKLSTSFLQYASDVFTSLPKEIDLCSYSRNSLVDVLTFYLPRKPSR